MKTRFKSGYLVLCIVAQLLYSTGESQIPGYKDRLARVRDIVNSQEMIMVWSQGPNISTHRIYQRMFDLDLTQPGGVDSTLIRKPLQVDSMISSSEKLAVASGNFLGGKLKHFVAVWEGPGDTVTVIVPQIDAATYSWVNSSRLALAGLAPAGLNRKIHVATGDLFGNRQDEFVVAFQGADSTIHLQVFSFNPGDLTPQPRGTIHDARTFPSNSSVGNWDINAGDFDGDGYHDIALLYVRPIAAGRWVLTAKIYTVDDQGNIIPKASQNIFSEPAYSVTDVNVVGTSGSFDSDPAMEIAFGFCFFQGDQSGNDTYVYLLDVKDNLNSIIISDSSKIALNTVGPNQVQPLGIAGGDLNNDSRDEVILMSGSTFYVYSVDDGLRPHYRRQQSVPVEGYSEASDVFIAAGDMDLDQRSEIVVAKNWPGGGDPGDLQHVELQVYSMNDSLNAFTLKARRQNELPVLQSTGTRHFAIALGDFDGDRTRLGPPVHYRRTGVMQPTVILHTPPIHYDILDSTVYDLSSCYPSQSCGFSSSYVQSMSFDTTITTEIHEDWGGDATVTLGFPVIKEKIKATYGDKFSLREASSRSMVITTGRMAAGDDWVYANVYDIDFYEYPVLDSVGATLGHFLVSIPGTPRPLWIEGKDDDVLGNQFRSDNEVGNVLSYRLSNTADTSRTIVNFPEQTVGSTGTSFASLQMSSFRENSVDSAWDAGIEVGVTIDALGDFKIWDVGVEVEVNGHYNYGEMYTQTVKVGNSIEVRGDLGHLQPQFGTSGTYYVKPYAYWSSTGALVLDYQVSPLPVGENSLWLARYGAKSDPAFSLPWRYDPEKGLPLPNNDPSYRLRTRDIALSKAVPRGGDTVRIGARVRNYGLQAITNPVTVRFYKGDPATTGTLLGETVIDKGIPARGTHNVFVTWAIPLSEPLSTARIYAVVDPANAITNEVHENNNEGWAPVISLGTPTGVDEGGELPEQFGLHPPYPNPFNPMTTIRYDLPKASKVSLKVFNVLGQVIVTLADEVRSAGSHHVHFNGAGLPSGVYFYRLEAKPRDNSTPMQIATGKALLIR